MRADRMPDPAPFTADESGPASARTLGLAWLARLRRGVELGLALTIAGAVLFGVGYCRGASSGPDAPGQAVLDSLTARADSLTQVAAALADSLEVARQQATADSARRATAAAKVRVVSPGVVEIRPDPLADLAPRVERIPVEVTDLLEADRAYIRTLEHTVQTALAALLVERARANTERARAETAIAQRDAERRAHRAREIKQGAVLLGVGALLGMLLAR